MKYSKEKTSGREECHGNVQGTGDWRMTLMDSKLKVSKPYFLRAEQACIFLHCFRSSVAKSWKNMILPLYSALVKPYMECCISCWALQYLGDMAILERVQ